MQLTHDSSKWGMLQCPDWSPNGKWLALVKGETGEIVMMPALGGHEVVLGRTDDLVPPGVALSWSPDGKDLAFEDSVAGIEGVPGSRRAFRR